MATPEDYLRQILIKDYRKEKNEENKTKYRQTQEKHVGFASVVVMTEPRPPISPSIIGGCYLMTTRPSGFGHHTAYDGASYSPYVGVPRSPYDGVPADLAARGIKMAFVKPSRKRCGVERCSIDHDSHYCNECRSWDVRHTEYDCPRRRR